MKPIKKLDVDLNKRWGGSNYLNVSEVRSYVKEFANKVEVPERRDWVLNTATSYILAHLGVTYGQRIPLPALPTRPAHGTASMVEMAAWEVAVAEVKRQRAKPHTIELAEHGAQVEMTWGYPIRGRYRTALTEQMKPVPAWIAKCISENKTIHAFMPGEDLDAVMGEVVLCLNSPLPEMNRLTFRSFDQMLTLVRNTDFAKRLGYLEREEALRRLSVDPDKQFAALGQRVMFSFPDGHFWTQLVPTPHELAGAVAPFVTKGLETRSVYRALLDETAAMSNGQGVAHFCLANGVYDCYLEGAGMVLSLRDAQNRPHVTVAIRNDGSIDQLQGRCNSVPKPAYFSHIWALAERFHMKASESNGSQARNVGLVPIDDRFMPITALTEGSTVNGNLVLKAFPQSIGLPERLTVEGTLDLAGVALAALPMSLTVRDDLLLKGCPISLLPLGLKVGRRLDITGTNVQHLPADLDAADLRCDWASIPETEVREFLFRTKINTFVLPKFKRSTVGATDAVDMATVEKQWNQNLAYNEGLWNAQLPSFRHTFMTSKAGNIGLLVKKIYSDQIPA